MNRLGDKWLHIWKLLKLIWHQIVEAVVKNENSGPVSLEYFPQIIFFECQVSIAAKFNNPINAKNKT